MRRRNFIALSGAAVRPLRDGFKDAGYVEGSLIFEDWFLDRDHPEKMDLLAHELVDLKCDLICGGSRL